MLAATIARFISVGIANTLIDFSIYNILTLKRINFSRIRANLVSTTIAMVFSFFANQRFVFESHGNNILVQAVLFYAVTAFGLYVLQNLVIFTLSKKWTFIPDLAIRIVHFVKLGRVLSDEFVSKNTAKIVGTVVSLTWNFIMYKRVVFSR